MDSNLSSSSKSSSNGTQNSSQNGSQSTSIKTFAFFDLETTGLPDLEFFKTKITELSIVAIAVSHFLEEKVPRIQHKLTLCFNPFKRIDLRATEITGLTNEMLEQEKKFDKNAMNLLESFLFQLQQPVCLIAHNGNKFDIPLLKKQYDKLEGAFPFSIKCCDSLPVFQKIDEAMTTRNDARKAELLYGSFSLQQWTDINDDGLLSADIEDLMNNSKRTQTEENGIDTIFQQIVKTELEMIEQENKKPTENDVRSIQAANETTPKASTKATNLQPHANAHAHKPRQSPTTGKRELFPSTSSANNNKRSKKSFTLREIYKRLFNAYPEHSHDAESDVISLLKCAAEQKEDFVKIVNEICIDFKDAKKF